ncbi:hypothetical protein RFI_24055 [Reticulomyxa filosa]|uniref:Uncharacterized protein n=1 Tax=Reticulomyxa filosa TaxID=46433 RepID=X6MJT1_RETFI|nr:hypothetical protein RFI_24055 [Reticulomyxa filosa]|eukprot:ETO13320.1 hypothetical protein RFI_24055 [Reticulomyxa filosa]
MDMILCGFVLYLVFCIFQIFKRNCLQRRGNNALALFQNGWIPLMYLFYFQHRIDDDTIELLLPDSVKAENDPSFWELTDKSGNSLLQFSIQNDKPYFEYRLELLKKWMPHESYQKLIRSKDDVTLHFPLLFDARTPLMCAFYFQQEISDDAVELLLPEEHKTDPAFWEMKTKVLYFFFKKIQSKNKKIKNKKIRISMLQFLEWQFHDYKLISAKDEVPFTIHCLYICLFDCTLELYLILQCVVYEGCGPLMCAFHDKETVSGELMELLIPEQSRYDSSFWEMKDKRGGSLLLYAIWNSRHYCTARLKMLKRYMPEESFQKLVVLLLLFCACHFLSIFDSFFKTNTKQKNKTAREKAVVIRFLLSREN